MRTTWIPAPEQLRSPGIVETTTRALGRNALCYDFFEKSPASKGRRGNVDPDDLFNRLIQATRAFCNMKCESDMDAEQFFNFFKIFQALCHFAGQSFKETEEAGQHIGGENNPSAERMHNRIREYREALGMTQEELAKKAGISRPFLSTVETGTAIPTVAKAADIAAALETTVDELFKKEGVSTYAED